MTTQEGIMTKIAKIIDESNANTFTVTGYCTLETRLVLHYHDCKQVFDFKVHHSGEIVVSKFFTKDFEGDEAIKEVKTFKKLHEQEKPE